MSPARSIALGEHLGGRQRVGTVERGVGDEDRLGRTHRERGAQARHLVVRRHRDERDLAAAGGVDELQRHLDAVAVGLVEDQLAVAVERVVGVERTRHGRVGDLLHADDDVHGTPVSCGGRAARRGRGSPREAAILASAAPRRRNVACPAGIGPRRIRSAVPSTAGGAVDSSCRRRPGRRRGRAHRGRGAGLQVVCVDQARFPRDKTCGDGLTTQALRLLEAARPHPRRRSPPPGTCPVHECVVVSPSGRRGRAPAARPTATTPASSPAPASTPRSSRCCRGAGVDVREGAASRSSWSAPTGVKVRCASGVTLEARHLVAADGHWSTVRRLLHPDAPRDLGTWHAVAPVLRRRRRRAPVGAVRGGPAPRVRVGVPDAGRRRERRLRRVARRARTAAS